MRTLSPLFYVEARIPAGKELPITTEHQERAAYIVEGSVRCGAELVQASHMVVFAQSIRAIFRSIECAADAASAF